MLNRVDLNTFHICRRSNGDDSLRQRANQTKEKRESNDAVFAVEAVHLSSANAKIFDHSNDVDTKLT